MGNVHQEWSNLKRNSNKIISLCKPNIAQFKNKSIQINDRFESFIIYDRRRLSRENLEFL